MSVEMTIGRCEFAEGPESVDQSGDVLTISGDLVCDSYAELSMRRLQLNGMVDNSDEDVFPATFAALPELDGFYAVEGVSVGSSPVMTASPVVPFSVTLRRVTDSHAPTIEIAAREIDRTNVHGLPSGLWLHTGFWRNTELAGWSTAPEATDRTTVDGVTMGRHGAGTYTRTHAGDPAEHYDGVARVEARGDDGVWYPVVGRRVPSGDVDGVRLSNGLMRMWFTAAGLISVSHWTGTIWSTVTYTHSCVDGVNTYTASATEAPTVVRSSLDVAAIRAWVDVDAGSGQRSQVTLSLSTGDRFGTARVTRSDNADLRLAFTTVPGGGLTTITGAMHHTANDADGNRPILMCPNGSGATGTGIWTGADYGDTFGVGNAIGGGSATTYNTVSALRNQFYNVMSTATRVVAR